MPVLQPRESAILDLIRRMGPLSRRELHQHTGLRPNTVGEIAGGMLRQGLLREGEPESNGVGRPRQPLEIDATRRRLIGVAFEPGRVSACQVNLHGKKLGVIQERVTNKPNEMIAGACALVESLGADKALAIGISATGFVDPETRSILTSSATKRHAPTSLDPLYRIAGQCPVLLENDMHARATYWLLAEHSDNTEDVLLVELRDGAVGAALLVNGRPNRGCVVGGNELGHTRFFVETEPCYCGHSGCLERICSSAYLRKISGDAQADLFKRLSHFDPGDSVLGSIVSHLAMGIANATNFVRPDRVVLSGKLTECLPLTNALVARVRGYLLAPIADRVRIDLWDKSAVTGAEAAAWLALAAIYRVDWEPEAPRGKLVRRRAVVAG